MCETEFNVQESNRKIYSFSSFDTFQNVNFLKSKYVHNLYWLLKSLKMT